MTYREYPLQENSSADADARARLTAKRSATSSRPRADRYALPLRRIAARSTWRPTLGTPDDGCRGDPQAILVSVSPECSPAAMVSGQDHDGLGTRSGISISLVSRALIASTAAETILTGSRGVVSASRMFALRREAMGGLAMDLRRIRAFGREYAAPGPSTRSGVAYACGPPPDAACSRSRSWATSSAMVAVSCCVQSWSWAPPYLNHQHRAAHPHPPAFAK